MARSKNHDLVIEHLTYDASHPSTPTQTQQQSNNHTTTPPNEQDSFLTTPSQPSTQEQDIVSHIMIQTRLEKAAHQTEKITIKANADGRRKEKFSEIVMARLNQRSSDDEENKRLPLIEKNVNVKVGNFQDIRDTTREGKLETLVPPTSKEEGDLLAPPSPTQFRRRPTSSQSAPAERNIKSPKPVTRRKSPVQKLAAYVEKGRDAVLQCRFHYPFDHIPCPSFVGRKSSACSSSSSFCCLGETDSGEYENGIQASSKRRLSGEGSSPWYDPLPAGNCRLCNKAGVQGIKGLGSSCEQNLIRPNTSYGPRTPDSDSEDEIKLTPPLKDRKVLSRRKSASKTIDHFVDIFIGEEEETDTEGIICRALHKDTGIWGHVNVRIRKPIVVRMPGPIQRADIKDVEEDEKYDGDEDDSEKETVQRWNAGPFSRLASPDGRDVLEEWSACYASGEYRKFGMEEDMVPLITKQVQKQSSRDTAFYRYWDEILESGQLEPPRRE